MRRLTDEEKISVVAEYRAGGCTCMSLASKYGITRQSITGLLKHRGIIIDPNRRLAQRENAKANRNPRK